MGQFYRYLCVLAMLSLFLTSCTAQSTQIKQVKPGVVKYQDLLDKTFSNNDIKNWTAKNNCVFAEQLLSCQNLGIALWLNSEHVVKTVYFYVHNTDGFSAYKGELPFGLKYYDNRQAVEYKLNHQGIGNGGLPDEDSFPIQLHYWALYKKDGLTVIYNSPFADNDADIYAIVLTNE